MGSENFKHIETKKGSQEKISPTEPKYLEYIERGQAWMSENVTDYCFGNTYFRLYEMRQNELQALRDPYHEDHEETQQRYELLGETITDTDVEEHLEAFKISLATESQKGFLKLADKANTSKYTQKFIRESLNDPILGEKLRTIIINLPEEARKDAEAIDIEWTPEEKLMRAIFGTSAVANTIKHHTENMYVLEAIRSNLIPASEWTDMLLLHHDIYLSEKKRVLEYIPAFKEKIRVEIEQAIDAGELPLSKEKLYAVLERTQVDVSDGIESVVEKNSGFYIARNDGIYLSTTLLNKKPEKTEAQLYKVYVHELFHALSGKTIIQSKETFSHEQYDENDGVSEFKSHGTIQEQRIGLRILDKFRWLNEAVTESLTMQHDGKNETQENGFTILKEKKFGSDGYAYRLERELFELFISKYNLPVELFLKAYFEDYLPEERHSEKGAIPHWKELYRVINEKCGVGLLVELDKNINEKGIESVVNEFKEKYQKPHAQ